MGEEKFPDARIEREAVDAVPRAIDEHHAGAVQDIAGSHQSATRLEHILHRSRTAG